LGFQAKVQGFSVVRESIVYLTISFVFFCTQAFGNEKELNTNTTVITAEDITKEKPADIVDMLRSRVGLDDSSGVITMRGVKGVVIYIDGFPSTLTDMRQVKPEQVERIEILRGAASSRFGADAMGGAIVVSTKKAAGEAHLDIIHGYNSSNSRYTRIIGTGEMKSLNFSIMGEDSITDGYKRVTASPYPYQISVDKEMYKRKTVDAKLGYIGENKEANLNIKYYDSDSYYGRPNWRRNYNSTTVKFTSSLKPSSKINLNVSLGYEGYRDKGLRDKGTGIDEAGLAPDRNIFTDGNNYNSEVSTVLKGENTQLSLGIYYGLKSESNKIVDYQTVERRFQLDAKMANGAVFALYEASILKNLKMDISGRYDRYWYLDTSIYNLYSSVKDIKGEEIVKDSFNPKIGVKWDINEKTSVNGSIGTGFITPTPYQLYYSDISDSIQWLQNPDLKPERSTTADVGLKRSFDDGLNTGLALFYTLWRDKIGVIIVDYGTPLKQQYQNIGEAESKGMELQIDKRLDNNWLTFFNYSYTRTEITENKANPSFVGNELPDMPRHKFNVGVTYERKGDFTGRALLRYVGSSYTDEKNTIVDTRGYRWKRDGYYVMDISFVKHFHPEKQYLKDITLTLAIDNLFDKRYHTGFFGHSEGRIIRGEAALRF
jgi:outer membrane receptor protein involved in Fe transport